MTSSANVSNTGMSDDDTQFTRDVNMWWCDVRGVAKNFSLEGPNYIFIHKYICTATFLPPNIKLSSIFFSFNIFSLNKALKNNWKFKKRKLLFKYCRSLMSHILSIVFFFFFHLMFCDKLIKYWQTIWNLTKTTKRLSPKQNKITLRENLFY